MGVGILRRYGHRTAGGSGVIVKIQRPLMTNGSEPMALVYNRSRSFEAHMPMTSDIAALFDDGSLKVYHSASLDGDKLLIGKRLPWEPSW